MLQSYSLTEAKAKFSEIINRIVFKKETFVITKKGKAVAVVMPIEKEQGTGPGEGLIRARGALSDLDSCIDEMVDHAYEARRAETDREVTL